MSLTLLPALAAALVNAASAAVLRRQSVNSTAVAGASARIPLQLAGASCADPPSTLPKYCCNGIMPNVDYAGTCDCNPGWSHQECMCKAFLAKMPCHQCMVHLPGTNRWMTTFSEKELYQNCENCVVKCKA